MVKTLTIPSFNRMFNYLFTLVQLFSVIQSVILTQLSGSLSLLLL